MSTRIKVHENVQAMNKVPTIKKLVRTLIIISIVAVILIIIVNEGYAIKGPREAFIGSWITGILIIFAIPILFGALSLAFNVDKIKPKVWLIIYSCAIVIYIIISIKLGAINIAKDLPFAVREDFSNVKGSVQILTYNETSQTIIIGGIQFNVPREFFDTIKGNEEYTIYFLPNSKTVMKIIDENNTMPSQ